MHFRINHVEIPTEVVSTIQKGDKVLKVVQTFKRTLGSPGPFSESQYGMTVAGLLTAYGDHTIIKWGFSMVRGENFIKRDGCDRAEAFALENEYTSENMTYDEAKAFAKELSQEVWKRGYKAMDSLFRNNEALSIFSN